MKAVGIVDVVAALAGVKRTDELIAGATAAIDRAGVGDSSELDARLLLWYATAWPVSSFIGFPERYVPRSERVAFVELVQRRVRGEPVAYIMGSQGFWTLELLVSPDVLVPRPETELLVEATLERCSSLNGPAVLDVGTGSGAIAIAVKKERRDVRMTGLDASSAALETARANETLMMGTREPMIRWLNSRWFESLPGEGFDLIVSNPPYVRTGDITGPLTFEPRLALDGGTDGLDAYRVLFAESSVHLNPGGALLVEHGADQRPDLIALAAAEDWRVTAARDDLAGRPRVLELERQGES